MPSSLSLAVLEDSADDSGALDWADDGSDSLCVELGKDSLEAGVLEARELETGALEGAALEVVLMANDSADVFESTGACEVVTTLTDDEVTALRMGGTDERLAGGVELVEAGSETGSGAWPSQYVRNWLKASSLYLRPPVPRLSEFPSMHTSHESSSSLN